MTMVFFPLILFLSLLFTRLVHPLSAGIILLIQTTLISLASGVGAPSFWFSYILFLIFLGGMLVLFIYVASLASNEPFKISITGLFTILSLSSILSILMILMDPFFSSYLAAIPNSLLDIKDQTSFISSLTCLIYNFPAAALTLYVILYLLLTLIAVVKVTSVYSGPLRFSK
uniref:NADH-ubiquinone oxidoreductase chain 6 n=1 Tax=Puerulus angulatus TaxID=198227 RepID=A0A411ATR3_9EUCA|nr:NADH dehydrogenase subunit 6 [Puerulus angulatus]QAX91409.1 NADH dehydrogenase subunit 6 [Puerulus angulatus]